MRNNKSLIIFSIIMVIVCFLSIFTFTLPAFSKVFDVSNSSAVGDTIGGITAPIIGIVSSILLYLALIKQTESNNDQKLRNEIDILFALFNQLDLELNSFYFTFKVNNIEQKFTGLEALDEFAKRFGMTWNMDHFRANFKSFKSFYPSGQIIYLIDSVNLINQRIFSSAIPNEIKIMFSKKMHSFYESKLKDSLIKIDERIKEYPFLEDEWTIKIREIVKSNN